MPDNLSQLLVKAESVIKVLLIEDNEEDYILTKEQLVDKRFKLSWAQNVKEGIQYLSENSFDAILLDLALPDEIGLSTFDKIYAQANQTPIIVLCGLDNDLVALAAVQRGAQDYLVKDKTSPVLLEKSLCYAIERKRMHQLEHTAIKQLMEQAPFAMAKINSDLIITEASNNFSKHFNLVSESAIGKNILEIVTDLPRKNCEDAIKNGVSSNTNKYAIWPIKDQQNIMGAVFIAK